MGRYPFLTWLDRYANTLPHVVGEGTAAERLRKLRYMHIVLQNMLARGEVDTTNPSKFGTREIYAFDTWMKHPERYLLPDEKKSRKQKGSEFDPAYKEKLWGHLGSFLAFSGNPILDQMAARGTWKRPKVTPKAKRTKDEAWFRDVMAKLEAAEGWPAIVVRFCVAFYWYNAGRSKELRLSTIDDLDTIQLIWRVRHPKGEGSFGVVGAEVDMFEEFKPYAVDFLAAREARLKELGLNPEKVKPLVPNEDGHFYDEGTWSSMRYKRFRKSGIQGDYRILRKSSLQVFMDALEEGGYKDSAIAELAALRGRHSVSTALKNYVDYRRGRLRKVVREVSKNADLLEPKPIGSGDRLQELRRLRDDGFISAEEFEVLRNRVLEQLVTVS